MLRRRYRLTVEFEVEMQELSMSVIHRRHAARLKWREEHVGHEPLPFTWEPPRWNEVEDMRALQRAIVETPGVFDAWNLDSIRAQAKDGLDIETVEHQVAEDMILLPAVETLPPRQRHRYREAAARERLCEQVDEMLDSIVMKVDRATVEVVE